MWACSAQSSSKTGVSACEIALPGPSGARPQPSRITSATDGAGSSLGSGRKAHAASQIARKSAGSRLAPADEGAVDLLASEQLLGVVGLDRAAVEDPDLRGCFLESRSATTERTKAIASSAWSGEAGLARCRSPRWARTRSRSAEGARSSTVLEVGLELPAKDVLGDALLALLIRTPRCRGSAGGRRREPRRASERAPRPSRRRGRGARSGRGSRPRRRSR